MVSEYGVPISIVDCIQKICPKCTASCSSDDCSMRSDETMEQESKRGGDSASSRASATPIPQQLQQLTQTPPPISSPPAKKLKVDNLIMLKTGGNLIKIEPQDEVEAKLDNISPNIFPDSNSVFESALANAFQNSKFGEFDKLIEGSGGASNSDDAISISSNLEIDEDETQNPCVNPQLLASFISSTPNMFIPGNFAKLMKTSASQQKRDIPPSLTVNGKTRRGRIVYTPNELEILEKYYSDDPNACADPAKRNQLCKMLDIDYHRLKVWFQNRRRKDKIISQSEEHQLSF
ncbi:unnamed protein product [Caenorhabditis angaria]|uniref:Homeobox domain-containing protein n=1 Tax=Caenorhabditis angaria TaxID=860376 RepID=A0A9P1MW71_9PELO|nr:unnamed protein product [Caenorhabditis angaria]